jgi:hypothetical protein
MFGVSKMPRKHLENPRNRVFGVGIQTGTIIVQAALVESSRSQRCPNALANAFGQEFLIAGRPNALTNP